MHPAVRALFASCPFVLITRTCRGHHADEDALAATGGVLVFTLSCRFMFPIDEVVMHEGPAMVARRFRVLYEGNEELLPETMVYDDACHERQHMEKLARTDKWWKKTNKQMGVCCAFPAAC